jgi:hypothetical protein
MSRKSPDLIRAIPPHLNPSISTGLNLSNSRGLQARSNSNSIEFDGIKKQTCLTRIALTAICNVSGHRTADHFVDVNKIIGIGSEMFASRIGHHA